MNSDTTTPGNRAQALDRAAAFADSALKAAMLSAALVRRPSRRSEDLNLAEEKALAAGEAAGSALGILIEQGAVLHALPAPEPVDLFKLDTPANRRLLAILDSAVLAAEEVDAERGRIGEKISPGDTAGTDLAESLNQLRSRVHMEVHGATGKD